MHISQARLIAKKETIVQCVAGRATRVRTVGIGLGVARTTPVRHPDHELVFCVIVKGTRVLSAQTEAKPRSTQRG